MADLIPTAKNFARDIASDAVNFPKTMQSWPAFKLAVFEAYKEIKSDLFFYNRDTLNPLTVDAVTRLDEIFKKEDNAGKVDEILGVKQEALAKLDAIHDAQEKKGNTSLWLIIPTALVGGLAFGIGGVLGALAIFGGAAMKLIGNRDDASSRSYTIGYKVNDIIQKIDPALVLASPRAQKVLVEKGLLKQAFKAKEWLTGDPVANYTALVEKLPKPAPVVAAPAAPAAGA